MVSVLNLDCIQNVEKTNEAYHTLVLRRTGKYGIIYKMNVLDYETNSIEAKPLVWKFDGDTTYSIEEFLDLFRNSDGSIDEERLVKATKFILERF